jgi:hypothetical protein
MDKFILTRFENGRVVQVASGNTLESMRAIADNSLFSEGHAIYETRLVEYGDPRENDYDWQDSWALTEDREYYEGLMGLRK